MASSALQRNRQVFGVLRTCEAAPRRTLALEPRSDLSRTSGSAFEWPMNACRIGNSRTKVWAKSMMGSQSILEHWGSGDCLRGHSTRWRQHRFALTPYPVPSSEERGEERQPRGSMTSRASSPKRSSGSKRAYFGIGRMRQTAKDESRRWLLIKVITPEIEGCALIGDCGSATLARAGRPARHPPPRRGHGYSRCGV